jgi:hypothetical protein
MEIITYEDFVKNKEAIFKRLYCFINENPRAVELNLIWHDHIRSIGILHDFNIKYAEYTKLTQFLEQSNYRHSVGTVALERFNSVEIHAFPYFIGAGFVYEQLTHLINSFMYDVIRVRDIAKDFSLNNENVLINSKVEQ